MLCEPCFAENKKKNLLLEALSLKYPGLIDCDTELLYTAEVQGDIIDSQKKVLLQGYLFDCLRKDSEFVVCIADVKEDPVQFCLAKLVCSPDQLTTDLYAGKPGFFVFSVDSSSLSEPGIQEYKAEDEDDHTYNYKSIITEHLIRTFYGKLVEYKSQDK